jgi:hypothetical protein
MGSNVLYTGFFGKQFFNQQLKKFFRHPPRIDTWPKIDNKKTNNDFSERQNLPFNDLILPNKECSTGTNLPASL